MFRILAPSKQEGNQSFAEGHALRGCQHSSVRSKLPIHQAPMQAARGVRCGSGLDSVRSCLFRACSPPKTQGTDFAQLPCRPRVLPTPENSRRSGARASRGHAAHLDFFADCFFSVRHDPGRLFARMFHNFPAPKRHSAIQQTWTGFRNKGVRIETKSPLDAPQGEWDVLHWALASWLIA